MKDKLSKVKNKFLVLLAMLTIAGANVVPSTIAMAESLDNTEQVDSSSEIEEKKTPEESTESSSKVNESTTAESTQNTQTELDKTIGESMNSNDSPIDSTTNSSEATNTEATSTTEVTEETHEKAERTGEELANRDNPTDVQGLTDNEIISLAKYLYGDYAKKDSSFGMSVKNDKGESIEIPFERRTRLARSIGTEGNPIYVRYDVSKGAWTAWGEFYQPMYIDGKLAYCVQPGVVFVPGAGFTQQTEFAGISLAERIKINDIMNFGAKSGDSVEYIMATNMYIWEQLGWSVSTSLPNYAGYKNTIIQNMKNFQVRPSFHNKDYNIKQGQTIKIPDTNGVLGNFVVVNNSGLTIKKNGNTLEVTATASSKSGRVDFDRKSYYSGNQYFWVKPGSQSVSTAGASDPTIAFLRFNVIKNGKAKIKKVDDNGNPVSGAKFELKNLADGSKKKATTNKNGEFESVEYAADTQLEIREIEAPIGYLLDTSVKKVTIKAAQTTTVNFTNPKMTLKTTATDKEDSDKVLSPEKNVTIKDKVNYTNLYTDGREYVVKGKLMDKATNKPLLIDGEEVISEATFKPTKAKGTIDVTFEFDARELKGKELVVFEYLSRQRSDSKEWYDVVKHADINDKGQTVKVNNPQIQTEAHFEEDGSKVSDPLAEVTIVDVVSFKNLIPGNTYELKGKLMDKATNKPLLIDGEEVTDSKRFTPTTSEGSETIEFKVNAKDLQGKTVVVFENLYKNDTEIAIHADIEDEGQTVEFTEPKLKTTALDNDSNSHSAEALKEVTITDTVSYSDLLDGKVYNISGVVMDKKTNTPLLIDGKEVRNEVNFIARDEKAEIIEDQNDATDSEQPGETDKPAMRAAAVQINRVSGTVEVTFTMNAEQLKGKSVVIFETLTRENTEIAVHHDIDDEGQTVTFTEPKLKTTAINQDSGDHKADALEKVTITDTVSYTDLIEGKTYELAGVLMDKATNKPLLVNGKEVRNSLKFIARNGKAEIVTTEAKVKTEEKQQSPLVTGTVDLSFELNAKDLQGKETVVFETLTRNETEVAVHADIHDKDQTIEFNKPTLKTTATINNGKLGVSGGQMTINDKVKYTNLTPGKTYTVKGKLMDKTTNKPFVVNGKEVQAVKTFVPKTANGEVIVPFTFDSKGITSEVHVVVFEDLYRDNLKLTTHADINDLAQTVRIVPPTKFLPKTGEQKGILFTILGFILLAGAAYLVTTKRKQNN